MKNIYRLLTLIILAFANNLVSGQSSPLNNTPCMCTDTNVFNARTVPIAGPAGQCCYAIQVKQNYLSSSACLPIAIRFTTSLTPTVAFPWTQTVSGTTYTYTWTSSFLPTGNVYRTVATICFPQSCSPIPPLYITWLKDATPPQQFCEKRLDFYCIPPRCNLNLSNQTITCIPPAGNYLITYTLTNNSCLPCLTDLGLSASHITLMSGTTLPNPTLIPAGGSITQSVSVTAVSGASGAVLTFCCNVQAFKCCITDTIPFPPCVDCRKGCLTGDKFCDKGATTIRALYCDDNSPINTSNITWYRAPKNPTSGCPAIPTSTNGTMTAAELAAWGGAPFQTSGNTATTSSPILTSSWCYIAYVNESADCHYWTSVSTVFIYPTPVISGITNKEICDPNISDPNITAPSQSFTVPLGLGQYAKWYRSSDCINYTLIPALPPAITTIPNVSSTFNSGGLNGNSGSMHGNCDTAVYCYRLVLDSKFCGSAYKDFKITVFSKPDIGRLTATPRIVCDGQPATILRTGGCGKIIKWERSDYNSNYNALNNPLYPNWTDITAQYGTANNFSTNNLHNSTNCILYRAYRVTVENGPCGQITSRPVIVQILPDLKNPILTSNRICIPPAATLTCQLASCPPTPPLYPLPPVIYTWFRDIPSPSISTTTTPTLPNVLTPGTYWVNVSYGGGFNCGSWSSNPVTLCPRPVLRLLNGCICVRPPSGGPYSLAYEITGGCSNCTYNYSWKVRKNNLPWSASVSGVGLVSGSGTIIIPSGSIPALGYGDVLHFQVQVTSSSCGGSCIPGISNINTVTVCPR